MSFPRRMGCIVLTGLMALLAACASQPVAQEAPQPAVDLQRFMGTWYVIALVPYFAERGYVASRYEYSPEEPDKVRLRYLFQEGFDAPLQERLARASVHGDSGNRRWTLWFGKVVPAKFNVLEVAPDYSWALINYPGRDMGWVFSRSPDMDDGQYQNLVKKMRDHGVNARQLERVPQRPDQVGKPGFMSPDAS